jgi:hypothetical protein
MNREIKYRGLTSNKTWVYGNLIQGKNGTCYICSINENPIYKNRDNWYTDIIEYAKQQVRLQKLKTLI